MVRHAALLLTLIGCSSHLPAESPDAPWPPAQAVRAVQAPPFALTASDGSGLELVRVEAKAVVEGPLALTELHLYFHNGEARTREGRFAITLPPRAAVSRFAMEIGDHMQEAEVVPKQLARRVYEDFLHHRQDPALLEKSVGNEFTARVFPIAPEADKHLVISFSQELAGEYVLPLRGLPTIAKLDARIEVARADGTHAATELHEHGWKPDRDFTAGVIGPTAIRAGELVAIQLAHVGTTTRLDPPTAITILVDTSASRGLGYTGYIDSIGDLVGALRARYGEIGVQVVAFDQDVQAIYDGPAAGFTATHRTAFLERSAAGASDLGQALASIKAGRRVVVITDGVVTAGVGQPELVAIAARFDRLDVVLAGGLRDDRLASALAHAGKRPGDVYDLDRGTAGVAIGLGERVEGDVPVAIANATWSYPRRLPAWRAGSDPVTVYARLFGASDEIEIMIGESDRRSVGIAPATPVMLERAVASAEIDELEQQVAHLGNDQSQALREQIAKRSVAARVVSSETSMLVLETENDYVRFGIDRKALANILVVGDHGIESMHRTALKGTLPTNDGADVRMRLDEGAAGKRDSRAEGRLQIRTSGEPQLTRQQAIEAARNAGVLGTSSSVTYPMNFRSSGSFTATSAGEGRGNFGAGRAGFGAGGGRTGMRNRAADIPTVSIGMPSVSGSLDTSIIRRYIKRHIAQVRYCYERELLARPTLQGTVTTQFEIGGKGRVVQSSANGVDPTVASCIADVIRKIEFPATDSTIVVNYPFVFHIAGAASNEEVTPVPSPPVAPVPPPVEQKPVALTGKLAEVTDAIARKSFASALATAKQWRAESPGDVLAMIALGEALEANRDFVAASRSYGSIIDVFPSRADLRRFAGERLERVAAQLPSARRLAVDTYRRAVADRPDHITGHRLLAHALLRAGDHKGAFAAILAGVDVGSTTRGADRIVREDAGIIASAYLAHGGPRATIESELNKRVLAEATNASTRFVLYWETDVNDVDFHIHDARGNEAFYTHPDLPTGGSLYADVTTGFGPECFAIEGAPKAGPYKLAIHYYSQGPMGYGMGLLQIERFDGKGNVTFEDRPYIIMVDDAFVDLGTVR